MLQEHEKPGDPLKNLALVTVVGARVDPNQSKKNHEHIAIDENSREVLHYAENTKNHISNLINCGMYLFSVRVFSEYGVNPYPDD